MEKLNFRVGGNLVAVPSADYSRLCTHLEHEHASKSLTRINNSNLGDGEGGGRDELLSPTLYPTFAPNHPSLPARRAVITSKH